MPSCDVYVCYKLTQCLLLLSETSIYRLVSLSGFSIFKGCQWKNCNRATKESIIYQKWMRDSAPSQIKKRFRPPPASAPPSSLLQHWLKCCVHLHLERHIKFAPMSNLVVLGWAHEKNDFRVGRYHKLTFTLSLDGRSFH